MADDPFDDVIRRLRSWTPPAGVTLTEFELELREQWGAAKHYLKGAQAGKVRALAGSLAAGATLREAFDRAGVSTATGYRLLRRPWVRR